MVQQPPTRMRDRWKARPTPGDDVGSLYWHVLLGSQGVVRAGAESAQAVLASLPGLHLTPLDHLHMTMTRIGPVERARLSEVDELIGQAQSMSEIDAIPVTVGKVLHHPEAIALAVRPVADLRHLRGAVRAATRSALGDVDDEHSTERWIPHLTIAYSTVEQPADAIVSALRDHDEVRHTWVESISLVAQWGDERRWDWQTLHTVGLRPRAADSR